MKYRREIDGLRALAVLPVILYHAGFRNFSGGFVGVDVFFVISGYLITTILVNDLNTGKFSLAKFYERRARRILPALFVVMAACLPFAWAWLPPQDMKNFSQSLISVSAYVSNVFFWQTSGYFDTASELKPLIHTWSLSVEEQFYLLFPIFLLFTQKIGRRFLLALLLLTGGVSFAIAQYLSIRSPAASFYLLPTRAWELLLGGLVALYCTKSDIKSRKNLHSQVLSLTGFVLIGFSVFVFTEKTPFPGFHALLPTVGAALIIVFSSEETIIGKFLGSKPFVGIGLISYSAYLWHQPIFAFARQYLNYGELNSLHMIALSIATLPIAYFTWRFVELPFRNKQKFKRKQIFAFALAGSVMFSTFGVIGNSTQGFSSRFDIPNLPDDWRIQCHGAVAISIYESPLNACLGSEKSNTSGDVFLLGDSHAAMLTFALSEVTNARGTELGFINTEDSDDFPYSFFSETSPSDEIMTHVIEVADPGDFLVISFHRGHLNESRDIHLPLEEPALENEKMLLFQKNMERMIPLISKAGIKIFLVKDGPFISKITNVEKCALNFSRNTSPLCSVSLVQDLHTRKRQDLVFQRLEDKFSKNLVVLDYLPILYGGGNRFPL